MMLLSKQVSLQNECTYKTNAQQKPEEKNLITALLSHPHLGIWFRAVLRFANSLTSFNSLTFSMSTT